MDVIAVPRGVAKLQYVAVRLPFTVLEQRLVARRRGEGAFVRRGFELWLGSLDRFAGWLLADEQISWRGQELTRRTGHPAEGGAPGTKEPVRPVHAGHLRPAWPVGTGQAGEQDRGMGGTIAADQDQEDGHQVRGQTGGRVITGKERATAGDAQARPGGGRAGEQPAGPTGPAAGTGTIDVRFTLPADVQADTVALCGEFNNWSAQDSRLERGGDGSWQATVALEPGRSYRYRYLLDGERWENAWHADRYVPNSYGGTDSVIIVE